MSRPYRTKHRYYSMPWRQLALVAIFSIGLVALPLGQVRAAGLSTASLAVSDPRPSTTNVSYAFNASGVSLTAIKCIKAVYSDTATGTNVPAGMSTASANLDTANTTYIPTPASWTVNRPANGTLTITNATGETPASAAGRKLTFSGITNASVPDTRFFLRVNSYTNTDCATGPVDSASVLFILTFGSTASLTVDQTLSFTVNAVAAGQACNGATSSQASTSTTIPFGTVSAAANAVVCQDLQAATNASNGFTVSIRYTGQPTNALAQSIANQAGTNGAPSAFPAAGTEAYGYTTNDPNLSTGPGPANRFQTNLWAGLTTTNAEVGYETTGVTSSTYRVGHQVGVSTTTRPGTYTTTVIYTCTPVY